MSKTAKDLRTPLARVRGLGSARDGTEHFIAQRLTAIALVPLLLWFVASVAISIVGADYAAVVKWMQMPFNTVFMIILVFVMFYHAHMGLQEVMEDYLHDDLIKTTALVLMKFVMITLTVAAVLAILRVALGG